MRRSSTCLFALALIAFALPYSARAESTAIQLLPPIQFPISSSGVAEPCAAVTGNNRFLTWDGASAMRCVEGLMVTDDGRVGIGTTSPLAILDVRTKAGQNIVFNSLGNGIAPAGFEAGPSIIAVNDDNTSQIPLTFLASGYDFMMVPGQNIMFGYDGNGLGLAGGPAIAAINNTNSSSVPLTFQASQYDFIGGNVGINTASPQSPLDVNGTINAQKYTKDTHDVISILGSVECYTPEGGPNNGVSWKARFAQGAATGCDSSGQAICSAGSPVPVMYSHDAVGAGELGGFCVFDASLPYGLGSACHVSLYYCE